MIPKINSSHGAETRNIINRVIEVLNQQGKSLQDLVAEGQLTEEQYGNLLKTVNGMLKSGEVGEYDLTPELRAEVDKVKDKIDAGDVTKMDITGELKTLIDTIPNKINHGNVSVEDIDKNKGKFDQTYMSSSLLEQIAGTAEINAVPADGSITFNKLDANVEKAIKGSILEEGININDLTTEGLHFVSSGSIATEELNFPPGNHSGVLEVRNAGAGTIMQLYTMHNIGQAWTRRRYNGIWSDWNRVGDHDSIIKLSTISSEDLNDVVDTGIYKKLVNHVVDESMNYPPVPGNHRIGVLQVFEGGGAVTQLYFGDRMGQLWIRDRTVGGTWYDWKRVGGESDTNYSKPTLEMEVTGRWTPNEKGNEFMQEMGKHELVETIEVGRSVDNRPIYAAVIGDPEKPAFYVNAASHGSEVGAAEAAWLMVREFTEHKNLMFMDMCVIVLPMQNPDNRFGGRNNNNFKDINRDWVDQTEPETHAAMNILNNYNVVAAADVHNFGYPRQVSLKETLYGTEAVKDKSLELFDVVTNALIEDGQDTRRYAPEAPNSSFTNGVAEQWNVATLLIEIPCGGYGDLTYENFYPTPYWQAHVGILSCRAIANHVWENLESFEALKEG